MTVIARVGSEIPTRHRTASTAAFPTDPSASAGDRCVVRTAALAAVTLCAWLGAAPSAHADFAGFVPVAQSATPTGHRPADSKHSRIQAMRVDGSEIRIDGRLDEPIWREAAGGSGFQIWEPDRGAEASEPTVFKVAYDDDALYFAFACYETDPEQISMRLSRRDRFSDSDRVSVYIDPYLDRTTGYNFKVNPLGVQTDAYIYNDGETDTDWDGVWNAETSVDGDGWYAEMRIPFSCVRYREGQSTWGLQVFRYMHRRGEDTAWAVWDREASGFVSRFGHLEGLEGIPAPRSLEVLPYFVLRSTDPAESGAEENRRFENFGADIKYGVTPDLTLNATVQPDFGQVEADPATLNLSPHETFNQEKRPFFVEGNRFFEHPDFNLFYSRRIGTGDETSRIRYAAKLTGKTLGNWSVAALAASTDRTREGQAHNLFKGGQRSSRYLVGRLGREFADGRHRFHVMQTAVINEGSREDWGNFGSREAYTTGLDFGLLTRDRGYGLSGSFVGSMVDPERPAGGGAHSPVYGTGGELMVEDRSGVVRGSAWGRWESDRLDINDIGFLTAPDEIGGGLWLQYRLNPTGEQRAVNRASVNLNWSFDWMYDGRTGVDLHTGDEVWSYDRWHIQNPGGNINGSVQFRGFQEAWFGVTFNPLGSQRWETRSMVLLEDGRRASIPGGGPLIDEPATWGGWIGGITDTRKDLTVSLEATDYRDTARNRSTHGEVGIGWRQSPALSHEIEFGVSERIDDTQHIDNFENPGGGVGGISYVFGRIHQWTTDITLRSSILFSRNQSLELYAQPYLTVGDYSNARELIRPDTYDLAPYARDGFRAEDEDFRYASVNLNAVYRWEFLPGSVLYLVWTQSRDDYAQRVFGNPEFDNPLDVSHLFRSEPENVFLAKVSYWWAL